MTPLPKRKLSTRRQGKRRASIQLSQKTLGRCPNCQKPVRPHTVCRYCGFYQGREVVKQKPPKVHDHSK